jgi:hypothetical protein
MDHDQQRKAMKFKIFSAPGDHRDDFESLENQMNEWSQSEVPHVVHWNMSVTAMTDPKNLGRYLMTAMVAYQQPAASHSVG